MTYREYTEFRASAPVGSDLAYYVEMLTGWEFKVYITPDDVCIAVPADDLCLEAFEAGQDSEGRWVWDEDYDGGMVTHDPNKILPNGHLVRSASAKMAVEIARRKDLYNNDYTKRYDLFNGLIKAYDFAGALNAKYAPNYRTESQA